MSETISLIKERLADLRKANDTYRMSSWDRSADIQRNDREIRWLIDFRASLTITEAQAIDLTEETLEAAAQALADDVWHPPIKLAQMANSEANKFRRQALLALKAATHRGSSASSPAEAAPSPRLPE